MNLKTLFKRAPKVDQNRYRATFDYRSEYIRWGYNLVMFESRHEPDVFIGNGWTRDDRPQPGDYLIWTASRGIVKAEVISSGPVFNNDPPDMYKVTARVIERSWEQ